MQHITLFWVKGNNHRDPALDTLLLPNQAIEKASVKKGTLATQVTRSMWPSYTLMSGIRSLAENRTDTGQNSMWDPKLLLMDMRQGLPTLVPDIDWQELKLSAPPPSSESNLTDQSSFLFPSNPTYQILGETASCFGQPCVQSQSFAETSVLKKYHYHFPN